MNNVRQPAFRFDPGNTVNIAATTGSVSKQVQAGNLEGHVRVFNSGAVPVFVRFGADSSVTASAALDCPVPAGGVEIFSAPYPWAAAITASGAAVVYFTPGEGL